MSLVVFELGSYFNTYERFLAHFLFLNNLIPDVVKDSKELLV